LIEKAMELRANFDIARVLTLCTSVLILAAIAGCSDVVGTPNAPPSVRMSESPTEVASNSVKSSMQDKLDSDTDLAQFELTVVDVVLVNKSDNEYKGIAKIRTARGGTHDVSIDVTADGDNVIWEAAPGAFLFALQEPPPTGPPAASRPAAVAEPQTLSPIRGMVYIATKSGKTRCQISASQVDCQAPFANTPLVHGYTANGLTFRSNGTFEWVSGDLGDIPVVTIGYSTYRALAWTIEASFDGTKFTHSQTGHSVFVSIDSVKIN
jgi:hypothetical protein